MSRGLWDRETVALLLIAATMPMGLVWLWYGGADAFGQLVLVLVVSGIWQLVFMLARAQPPSFAGVVSALGVAILAPDNLHTAQLVLGISFGSVMAELVFGGWGRNVLNPATVTLVFLGFGFRAATWPDLMIPVAWAAIPALLFGVIAGVMPARVIAGAVVALALADAAGLPVRPVFPAAGVVLALLVTDPVTSASTRAGGWMNGALYGALVVLFSSMWEEATTVHLSVAAAFLASLAAPLLDEIAIAVWLARGRARHG